MLTHAADFRPEVESLAPRSSESRLHDMIATKIKSVGGLVVGGVKALRLAADLNCLICRSRPSVAGSNLRFGRATVADKVRSRKAPFGVARRTGAMRYRAGEANARSDIYWRH
jgi:hypothetical protein